MMIDRINQNTYTKYRNTNNKEENKNNNQSFKGAGTAVLSGLRFLNNSPAIGACAVDFCSMVTPRTAIEFKNRGPQSGFETFFREAASCIVHACVGLIGLGAAKTISGKFNQEFGVKAETIFASGDTIKNMSEIWKSSNQDHKIFFDKMVSGMKGLNGTDWRSVSDEAKSTIVDGLVQLADKSKQLSAATGADKKALKKEVAALKDTVIAQITKDTGAQASFKLAKSVEGTKELSASLGELVDNAVVLSNAFKTKTEEELPKFVKALTKNKTTATLIGLGICAAICVSIQPINRWLTKKRTGQDGFVGVQNDEKSTDPKDAKKSQAYKPLKNIAGIAFPLFAIRTIGKPADLLSNIQFNSKVPSINQFKLLYGMTIGSRFLSVRDGNEFRESTIKDTLGFTNWLILGGMVSKLVARGLGGKELINNPISQEGKKGIKYAAKWLTQTSVKSFDEVLLPQAEKLTKDGKLIKFTEMFKNADPATKSKVAKLATSQVAGYLYSGLVLGIGISKLNIAITRMVQNKKKANQKMAEQVLPQSQFANSNILTQNTPKIFKDFT